MARKNASGFRDAQGDLRLENVTKSFAEFTAVDDLSLVVPRGSFFALLGPSGCGKTTTLRMVAGLEQPTSGRLLIGDTDLTGSRSYERPVNTVFQSYALFPHLDVARNVSYGLLQRSPRPRFAPRAAVVAGHRVDVVDHRSLPGCFLASVAVPRAMTSDASMIVYMLTLLPPSK